MVVGLPMNWKLTVMKVIVLRVAEKSPVREGMSAVLA
jgi:hypothetical protein